MAQTLSYWAIGIGIACAVIALLLLSPLSELLPIDFWHHMKSLVLNGSWPELGYLRVVPAKTSRTLELALLVFGVALTAAGLYFKRK